MSAVGSSPYVNLFTIYQEMAKLDNQLITDLKNKDQQAAERDIDQLQALNHDMLLESHEAKFEGGNPLFAQIMGMQNAEEMMLTEVQAGDFGEALTTNNNVGSDLENVFHIIVNG